MTQLIRNILAGSRLFVFVAVLGTFLAAVVLTVYGAAAVVHITLDLMSQVGVGRIDYSHYGVENLALEFIALIDIFLLSTVLYIIALGLYELFIDPDLPLPEWLLISSLDELKEKLSAVVIVLLGVNFLGDFVQNDGTIGILWLGLGAAAVILALASAFKLMPKHHGPGHDRERRWSPAHEPAHHAADAALPAPAAAPVPDHHAGERPL